MDYSIVDTFIFAPLAPLMGIILFWFIQLLMIESMKYGLSRIWLKHVAFCRLSNFLGVFFQALAHAAGYTVTGIGVAEFSVSVNDSKVSPKREKEGFSEWIANAFLALGPFFIPPFIIFGILLMAGVISLDFPKEITFTFSGMLIHFGSSLFQLGYKFLAFIAGLDLFNPFHFVFLLLLIAVGLGTRPSYIEGGARRVSMLYDLHRIKDLIISHPKYPLALLGSFYVLFVIMYEFKIPFYAVIFSILAFLSIMSIVAILLVHLVILVFYTSDRLYSYKRFIPFLIPIASYVLLRVMLTGNESCCTISLCFSLLVTFISCVITIKVDTNKLKRLKRLKQAEGAKNGKR